MVQWHLLITVNRC